MARRTQIYLNFQLSHSHTLPGQKYEGQWHGKIFDWRLKTTTVVVQIDQALEVVPKGREECKKVLDRKSTSSPGNLNITEESTILECSAL